jgi:hypothetical protein
VNGKPELRALHKIQVLVLCSALWQFAAAIIIINFKAGRGMF